MTDDQTPQLDDERPSRSAQKRAAQAIRELAAQLVEMSPAQLDQAGLPADIRAETDRVRGIHAYGARKRELGYLAKLMRRLEPGELDAARALLGANHEQQLRDAAELHRLEILRQRLLDDDNTLTALLEQHPALDRQHLRSLIRQARRQRDQGKPPQAARELFRQLRELLPAPEV